MEKCCANNCTEKAENFYSHQIHENPKGMVMQFCDKHDLFIRYGILLGARSLNNEIRKEWDEKKAEYGFG